MEQYIYNWKAAAADRLSAMQKQASETANDQDVEQAFAAQSYQFVANRCGDLMKDEHKIGFETVRKDDNNTRMLGIYGFKVEDTFIAAVVFFLNGEIKGPLLYRSNTSTFVPATKEWSSFLIESIETQEGKGRSRSKRYETAPRVNMQRIAFVPPSYGKQASDGNQEPLNPVCPCMLELPGKAEKSKLEKDTEKEDKKLNLGVRVDVPDGGYSIDDKVTEQLNKKPGQLEVPGEIKVAAGPFPGTVELTVGDFGTYVMSDAVKEAMDNMIEGSVVSFEMDGGVAVKLTSNTMRQLKEASEQLWQTTPDDWESQMRMVIDKPEEPLLRQFFELPGIGKRAAEDVVRAMDGSYEFTAAIASKYNDPSALFPERFTDWERPEPAECPLMMHFDLDGVKAAAEETNKRLFEDGFIILDSRPVEELSVIVEEFSDEVTAPNGAGDYMVLSSDGTFQPMFVGYKFFGDLPTSQQGYVGGCVPPTYLFGRSDREQTPTYYVCIDAQGRMTTQPSIMCARAMEGGPKWTTTLKEGKVYVLRLGDVIYPPFLVKKVSEKNGITHATIAGWPSDIGMTDTYDFQRVSSYRSRREGIQIKINPDAQTTNLVKCLIGADALFAEIKTTREFDDEVAGKRGDYFVDQPETTVGSDASITAWLENTYGARTVKLTKNMWMDTKSAAYTLSAGNETSPCMTRLATAVKMSRDMQVSVDTVYKVLDKVDVSGEESFYFCPCEKIATTLRVVEQPMFTDEFDSEFGVNVRPVQAMALPLQGDQIMETPCHIGDAYDPTIPGGLPYATVTSVEPDKLRALADSYNLPHVFQHATVGELADTYAVMPMMERFLRNIEDGVDVIGRLLFLLYWKPDGFEQAYGKDDMGQLETELKDNFDRLGSLYLKLLKKTDKFKVDGAPTKKDNTES